MVIKISYGFENMRLSYIIDRDDKHLTTGMLRKCIDKKAFKYLRVKIPFLLLL